MRSLEIPEVAEVATKTTGDLLELISGDDSAEGEAGDELARRIEGILNKDDALRSCGFRFGNLTRETANIFTVDVFVDDSRQYYGERFLRIVLESLDSVNSAVPMEGGGYWVSFDIEEFEGQLVQEEEPAETDVDESLLTVDQITKLQLRRANLRFEEAVQPRIGFSTRFRSVKEVDGRLRILATTSTARGDEFLSEYVVKELPFGFHVKSGESPSDRGVCLRISFENFEKLLPSTAVEEKQADVSNRVGGACQG